MRLVAGGLEILGTFLLTAEAIKLCSLRGVRLGFPTVTRMQISPIAGSMRTGRHHGEPWGLYAGIFLLTMPLIGDAVLLLRDFSFSDLFVGFRFSAPGTFFIDALVFAPAVLVAVATSGNFELFLIEVLAFPVLITIVLLRIWERHVGSGAIGDMGFAFLIAGNLFRVYLELLGA
jgi:hypothetical protein